MGQVSCIEALSPDSVEVGSRRFFQNFKLRNRLRLRDSRRPWVAFRDVVLSSESPLAMRGRIRGDSALDLPGVGGGVGEREFGAEAECAPSTPEGQVPGTTKESSGAASVC